MRESFGSLFGKAMGESKKDFGTKFQLGLLFLLLPLAVTEIIKVFAFPFSYLGEEALAAFAIENPMSMLGFSGFQFVASIVISLMSLVFTIYMIRLALKQKKVEIKDSFAYFGMFILLGLTMVVYFLGLFILLIIPAIIFSFYWIFAGFCLIDKGTGIHDSLRESFKLVKGNWWRTLGYNLVFVLVVVGVYLLLLLPIGFIAYFGGIYGSALISIFINLLTVPYTIFVYHFNGLYYRALQKGN